MAATRRMLLKTVGAAAVAGKLFAPREAEGAESTPSGKETSPRSLTTCNLRGSGLGVKLGDRILDVARAAKQLHLAVPTSTVPSVGGWWGDSPAISRSTVDLPQPDGPRIATNSPAPDTSGTQKVTSLMIVRPPNRFVTCENSTTLSTISPRPRGTGTGRAGRRTAGGRCRRRAVR